MMQTISRLSDEEVLSVAGVHAPMVAALWLARGAADSQRVEWDGGFNYCQIQRDPFDPRVEGNREKKLIAHLRCIESVVLYGRRDFDTSGLQPRAFSGGLQDIDTYPADAQLLFLRSTSEIHNGRSDDDAKSEFLSEFTIAPRVREAVAA